MNDVDLSELSEDEIKKLKENIDPDINYDAKYSWHEDFQRNVIALLLNDRWFAIQCKDLIENHYFVDEVHQLLCKILFNYLEKYNILPQKTFVIEEVQQSISNKSKDVQERFISETILLYKKYIPNLESREYLLEKILNFAKLMGLKKAFDVSLQLIQKNPDQDSTWSKIQSVLQEALLVDRNFNEGLNYFESFEERFERLKEEEETKEKFTSGFDLIDNALLGGGPHRGEIYSWIGMSGTGKSLALVTGALKNVKYYGKKVLYVSLEMDEDKIAERFDAQFAGIKIGEILEKEENVNKIKDDIKDFVQELEDKKLLLIKQFPAGSMSVNTLRAYLQQLYMNGFKPDLLVIDYIGEMKDHPGVATHESRYKIVRDLRGLATEEGICIFTAMQPNKTAREAQNKDNSLGSGFIDDTNLADSYGQIRPLDGCWSINQMNLEKKAAVARIFVIKHRHGKSRFSFHIEYDQDTLEMREISKDKYDLLYKNEFIKEEKTIDENELQEQKVAKEISKNKSKKTKKEVFESDPANNYDMNLDEPDEIGD